MGIARWVAFPKSPRTARFILHVSRISYLPHICDVLRNFPQLTVSTYSMIFNPLPSWTIVRKTIFLTFIVVFRVDVKLQECWRRESFVISLPYYCTLPCIICNSHHIFSLTQKNNSLLYLYGRSRFAFSLEGRKSQVSNKNEREEKAKYKPAVKPKRSFLPWLVFFSSWVSLPISLSHISYICTCARAAVYTLERTPVITF